MKPNNILKWITPEAAREQGLSRNAPAAVTYLEIVREVIGRREEGVQAAREPLDAFGLELDKFGAPEMRQWWAITRGELHRASSGSNPMTVMVLSAAISECALAIVARRAQVASKSNALQGEPKKWTFEQLYKWAKKGAVGPIIDDTLGRRCQELNLHRQRIHGGRFLGQQNVPQLADARPDEARESRETMEKLLRAILDWDSKGAL